LMSSLWDFIARVASAVIGSTWARPGCGFLCWRYKEGKHRGPVEGGCPTNLHPAVSMATPIRHRMATSGLCT
jgi:hypothetical protein